MDLPTLSASIISSVTSKMLVYPLDTIAIQNQTSTTRPLFPPDQSLAKSFRGLYRGLGISIMITTPAVALYLCTYRQAKESLMPYLGETTGNYVVSGICAEGISSFMWTPLEVLKARLQISSSSSTASLRSQVRGIFQSEGIGGFYRGYAMGLAVYIPYNAVWWSSYENSKSVTQSFGIREPAYQAAIGSALATTLSTSLAHPLDLLKTRFQVSTPAEVATGVQIAWASSTSSATSFARTVGGVVYAGIGPRLFCSIPSSVIAMAVFEYLKPDDNTNTNHVVALNVGRRVRVAEDTEVTVDGSQDIAE
ncbi:Uncharacterized mitochondrial carrier C4G8.08 [Taphrina deformans PYCC 5710]|uniref:Uncharacterized mitochondrial carrier C4G8.08 n=1 Tax=Taphrina deformans (strain PYCC 5710 / ATCC 11124 / CBS 356.35 / IMI 108563 / JCM 9778 / NBRC 8474) TaxID=1097556 RepID=R4XPP3_TAPDE|nr:Uncharacterized mitochondrial carrier C4G8.08 [Taphrina deformans PYCC 5710]|eukprot:CCG85156.1 Uncharacterized mitochondrial carrier C4G8.08 [Taphrina deformans PYCC 5710]